MSESAASIGWFNPVCWSSCTPSPADPARLHHTRPAPCVTRDALVECLACGPHTLEGVQEPATLSWVLEDARANVNA
jgi:hypothetical protein